MMMIMSWILTRYIYPPKGAAIAEPVWGPIDFSYVLLFRVAVYERTWVFQKHEHYPPF